MSQNKFGTSYLWPYMIVAEYECSKRSAVWCLLIKFHEFSDIVENPRCLRPYGIVAECECFIMFNVQVPRFFRHCRNPKVFMTIPDSCRMLSVETIGCIMFIDQVLQFFWYCRKLKMFMNIPNSCRMWRSNDQLYNVYWSSTAIIPSL